MFHLHINSVRYPNQNSADLEFVFNPPRQLGKRYEVACVGGKVVNSVPNISAKLGNNTLRYSVDGGNTFKVVTLPDGSYTTTGLETELRSVMKENGDYTVVNGEEIYKIDLKVSLHLLRVQIELDADTQLDLGHSNLYQVLGFSTGTILDGGASGDTFTAEGTSLFTDRGSLFYIQTDIIDNGMIVGDGGNNLSGILKVKESSGLGFAVNLESPSGEDVYYPLNTKTLTRMKVRVLDAYGVLADFRGETTSFQFRFRPIDE